MGEGGTSEPPGRAKGTVCKVRGADSGGGRRRKKNPLQGAGAAAACCCYERGVDFCLST